MNQLQQLDHAEGAGTAAIELGERPHQAHHFKQHIGEVDNGARADGGDHGDALGGAEVGQGDLVAEIMSEKAQFEIEAPCAGVLKILEEEDAVIAKGATIGLVE